MDDATIRALDENDPVFRAIPYRPGSHTDHLGKGITVEVNAFQRSYEELSKEDDYWIMQHDPLLTPKDLEVLKPSFNVKFAMLRLWQWGFVNETARHTNSVPLFPRSLVDIENLNKPSRVPEADFVLEKYGDLSRIFHDRVVAITRYEAIPFSAQLRATPPFLSLLLDQALDAEHAVRMLGEMRRDYVEFRETRAKYSRQLLETERQSEKREIVEEWERAWLKLCEGNFRKPTLRSRVVSPAEISEALLKPGSLVKILIEHFIKNREYGRSYRILRVFCDLNEELDSIQINRNKFKELFNVEDFKE